MRLLPTRRDYWSIGDDSAGKVQEGRFVDELVVRDFRCLRLHLLAETACSQTVSMALIPGVQAELA